MFSGASTFTVKLFFPSEYPSAVAIISNEISGPLKDARLNTVLPSGLVLTTSGVTTTSSSVIIFTDAPKTDSAASF